MRNLLIFIRGCAICPCTLALIKESNGWKIFFATTNNDLREVYRALQKKIVWHGTFSHVQQGFGTIKKRRVFDNNHLGSQKIVSVLSSHENRGPNVNEKKSADHRIASDIPFSSVHRPFFFIPGNILPRSTCLKLCQSVIPIVERSWLKWFLVIKQEKTITQMENFQIHFFFVGVAWMEYQFRTTVNFKLTLLKT